MVAYKHAHGAHICPLSAITKSFSPLSAITKSFSPLPKKEGPGELSLGSLSIHRLHIPTDRLLLHFSNHRNLNLIITLQPVNNGRGHPTHNKQQNNHNPNQPKVIAQVSNRIPHSPT